MSHAIATNDFAAPVQGKAQRSGVRVVNGRLVSKTLGDPDMSERVGQAMASLRKDPAKLKAFYIQQGVLTPGGKLAKRFGG
ncbi:hypothetical protein AAFF27_09790 [Xylophilus sp. GW821-FHT01B05]